MDSFVLSRKLTPHMGWFALKKSWPEQMGKAFWKAQSDASQRIWGRQERKILLQIERDMGKPTEHQMLFFFFFLSLGIALEKNCSSVLVTSFPTSRKRGMQLFKYSFQEKHPDSFVETRPATYNILLWLLLKNFILDPKHSYIFPTLWSCHIFGI